MNTAVSLSPLSLGMTLSLPLFPYGLVEFPGMPQQFAPFLCSLNVSTLISNTPFHDGSLQFRLSLSSYEKIF